MNNTINHTIVNKILLLVFIFSFCSGIRDGLAQDISFEASVNANKTALASTVQLTLTINGTKDASPIELPPFEGFEAKYLGPSTRISVINGQYHSTVAFMYTLFPLKVGHFQIPAINVTLDGKNYSSQPIDMEVVDSNDASLGSGQGQITGAATGLGDKIFMNMNTSKKEVYVGEKVPLNVKIFVSALSVRDLEYPQFDHDGFSVDNFTQPNQYQQVVGGVQYNVIEFNTYVYPLRTGELKLGPARTKCNILYESSRDRQSTPPGFENFFNDDFFNGFLQNYEKRPLSLASTDLNLIVLPLPSEGQSPNFSGAVGQFDFEVSAAPQEVAVGDPVTLKMKISGQGNIKSLNFPTFENKDAFKLYDPQIKEEENAKILEQVVIPKSENVSEIPVISFTFFDPGTQTYQTIPRGPFPLKVRKQDKSEDFKVVGLAEPAAPGVISEAVGRDIIFIKEYMGATCPRGRSLYRNPILIGTVIFYLIGWIVLFNIYAHTRKIQSDTAYARKLHAPRKAKKGLEIASGFLEHDRQSEFYDAVFRTLRDYLGDKFHLATGEITFSAIENLLKERHVDGEVIKNIKSVFDDCDAVRYAAAGQDKEKMKENYRKVQEIIDFLERHRP